MVEQSHRLDEFRVARKLGWMNRLLQGILWVALIVGLNLFAMRFSVRWDITEDRRHSLSPETLAYVQAIDQPVRVVVAHSDRVVEGHGRDRLKDVKMILGQYVHAFERIREHHFSVEYVDVFRQRDRMVELVQDKGLDRENSILLESTHGRRILSFDQLYRKDDESGKESFVGQQLILSSLLEITDPVRKTLYAIVGQGEMTLRDTDPMRGLSEMGEFLRGRNVILKELDLAQVDHIPADADIVLLASPQAELRSIDVEKLRRYLESANGSLFVLLEPLRKHNLDELLQDWGLISDSGVVLDPGPDYQASSGNLILRRYGDHPITRTLVDGRMNLFGGQPRPIRFDAAAPRIAGVQRTVLVASSETSWMEMGFRVESVPRFDPDRDIPGPIPVAVVAERKGGQELGLNLRGGRLLVLGDASIASNSLFRLHGNRTFVANSVNWMLQREPLLNIVPTPLETFRLELSKNELKQLLWWLMLVPLVFAFAGLLIRVIRR